MSSKYLIGISAFYHDSSVCLFRNGQLVFACEEEKFSGIKHDNSFPQLALNYILKEYQIDKKDIEAVCYYENPWTKLDRVKKNLRPQIFKNLRFAINSYLKIKSNINTIQRKLEELSPNVYYSDHHMSHMYYSYFTSDFRDAMCLSIDGVGEFDTIAVGHPYVLGIDYYTYSQYPHSLGLFYSAMTAFLGFRPNEGEYKVMGLSSYGNPQHYISKVRELIKYEPYENNMTLLCNMDIFTWNRSDDTMFNEKLGQLLGIEQRLPDEPMLSQHKDIAAAVQMRYEEILFDIINQLNIEFQTTNLCLGGGCAYNGLANGKIIERTSIKHIWIPPAPSDAGSCIGACLNYLHHRGKIKTATLQNRLSKNPFLGPIYENYDIEKVLRERKVHYSRNTMEKLIHMVACELNKGKVVGWYQGHMEFGARALGNRSILADPTRVDMKDRINKVIKKRESFRPFAPMVIKEKQSEYFEMSDDIPYMNQVVKVKSEYINKLPSVTHIDGTARVQTVYENTLPHKLLLEFEKLSGLPILLNTSFNVKDKTMVLTPEDALDTFYDTDMDILVMNNFIIHKKNEDIRLDKKEN